MTTVTLNQNLSRLKSTNAAANFESIGKSEGILQAQELGEAIAEFESWILNKMPVINSSIDSGDGTARAELLEQGNVFVRDITHNLDLSFSLSLQQTSRLCGELGMFVASCLKHGIKAESPELQEPVALLHRLSEFGGHPPRDTLETYVLNNEPINGRFAAFTTLEDEQAFIRLTKEALECIRSALSPLRDFDLDNHEELPGRLREAQHHVKEYQKYLLSFMAKTEDGSEAVRPQVFYDILRDYFPDFSVGSKVWGPPSAAYASEVMELDIRLGLVNEKYVEHVRSRLAYFPTKDRINVLNALDTDSLITKIIKRSSIPECPFHLSKALQRDGLVETAEELVQLGTHVGKAAASHWGLVANYLIKPHNAAQRPEQGAKKGCPFMQGAGASPQVHVVDPTKGASGMEFSEVKEFRDMRRLNRGLLLLQKAVDIATGQSR